MQLQLSQYRRQAAATIWSFRVCKVSPCSLVNRHIARNSGNVLLLVIAFIAIVALLAFFVTNMGLLFLKKNTSQSGVDAAALQTASNMARIVVETKSGRLALVDDLPEANSANQRPIIGVNTLLAVIRLDALIGQTLENSTIELLAKKDLDQAMIDIAKLNQKILLSAEGKDAIDKNGKKINLLKEAKKFCKEDVQITCGRLTDDWALTNTPIPVPNDLAQLGENEAAKQNDLMVYKAYAPINVPGCHRQIQLVALGAEPQLIDNQRMRSLNKQDTPIATVVQVSATQEVKLKEKLSAMKSIATAQAGGRPISSPTGALMINFVEGIAIGSDKINFTCIQSIMASAGKWDNNGIWSSEYDKLRYCDPSVALSCGVYDWLRTLGLRPNISAVKTALNQAFFTMPKLSHEQQPIQVAKADCCAVMAATNSNPWTNSEIRTTYSKEPAGTPHFYPGPHIQIVPPGTPDAQREYFSGTQAFHMEGSQKIIDSSYPPAKVKTPEILEYRDISGENYHFENGAKISDGFDYPTKDPTIRYVDYLLVSSTAQATEPVQVAEPVVTPQPSIVLPENYAPPSMVFIATIRGDATDAKDALGGTIKLIRCGRSPFPPDTVLSGQPVFEAPTALKAIGSFTDAWSVYERDLNGNNLGTYFTHLGINDESWWSRSEYEEITQIIDKLPSFISDLLKKETSRGCPPLAVEWRLQQAKAAR